MLKILVLAALIVVAVVVASTYKGFGAPAAPSSAPSASANVTAPTAAPGQISVNLTDDQASQALNQAAAGQALGNTPLGPATLSSLAVHFQPGQFTASGQASVGGESVPIAGTGTADLEGGQVVVHLQQVQVAGLPLPDGVRQTLEGSLQTQLNNVLTSSGVRVNSITLQSGSLVAVGSRA